MSQSLRIVFAGTPDFAATHLTVLLDTGHQVVAVYTQPDRPAGRGKKLTASPVKRVALEHDLPIYQPQTLKTSEAQRTLAELNADIMVVVAYGLLLPIAILETPRLGCINVHASLLPRWRGAAPIQRAVEAGDTDSGVTIMQMDVGLDTGNMLRKVTCPILPTDTGGDLHDKLMAMGGGALIKTLEDFASGTVNPEVQDDSLANYASKIHKQELLLDWRQSANTLARKIRAFSPFPVCYSQWQGERLKVHQAEVLADEHSSVPAGQLVAVSSEGLKVVCGDGSLLLLKSIQLPGKKNLPVADVLNGYADRFPTGLSLLSDEHRQCADDRSEKTA